MVVKLCDFESSHNFFRLGRRKGNPNVFLEYLGYNGQMDITIDKILTKKCFIELLKTGHAQVCTFIHHSINII